LVSVIVEEILHVSCIFVSITCQFSSSCSSRSAEYSSDGSVVEICACFPLWRPVDVITEVSRDTAVQWCLRNAFELVEINSDSDVPDDGVFTVH